MRSINYWSPWILVMLLDHGCMLVSVLGLFQHVDHTRSPQSDKENILPSPQVSLPLIPRNTRISPGHLFDSPHSYPFILLNSSSHLPCQNLENNLTIITTSEVVAPMCVPLFREIWPLLTFNEVLTPISCNLVSPYSLKSDINYSDQPTSIFPIPKFLPY